MVWLWGMVVQALLQGCECFCCHDRNLPVSKGSQSVHPMGQPISHSTNAGFSGPPHTALRGGVRRFCWLGLPLFLAS